MSNEEATEAADALVQWFRSQQISPQDSVSVMAKAIVAVGIIMAGAHKAPDAPADMRIFAISNNVNVCIEVIKQTLNDCIEGRP